MKNLTGIIVVMLAAALTAGCGGKKTGEQAQKDKGQQQQANGKARPGQANGNGQPGQANGQVQPGQPGQPDGRPPKPNGGQPEAATPEQPGATPDQPEPSVKPAEPEKTAVPQPAEPEPEAAAAAVRQKLLGTWVGTVSYDDAKLTAFVEKKLKKDLETDKVPEEELQKAVKETKAALPVKKAVTVRADGTGTNKLTSSDDESQDGPFQWKIASVAEDGKLVTLTITSEDQPPQQITVRFLDDDTLEVSEDPQITAVGGTSSSFKRQSGGTEAPEKE